MRRSKLLISIIFVLFVASCSTSPTGRGQLILKSDAELEAQARSTFNAYRATLPLATDRAKIDFVACVAQAVVAELYPPYSDIEWELAIFEQNQINAFAMPGGKIGVYTGILEVTENQDQLAAVIGHEIAHVTAKHVNERASRGALTGIGIEALAVIMGGGYTGGAYTASQVMSAGAALGMELPMGRGQESEADVVGLEYMAKAGFDPRAAVDLWQNMSALGGKKPPEHLSTHPASETRIENLISQWQKTLPIYNQARADGKEPDCKKTWN
jgi:predicted Zn-dependent protease